jgi:hypothetical protein
VCTLRHTRQRITDMRPATQIVLAAAAALSLSVTSAQAPAPKTTRERLDELIESWRGQPEQTLKEIWGRETTLTEGSSTKTYMYERSKRRGPGGSFGGVAIPTNAPTICTAYFQIGLENIVTRSTWRGADVSACWDLFREYAPPAATE